MKYLNKVHSESKSCWHRLQCGAIVPVVSTDPTVPIYVWTALQSHSNLVPVAVLALSVTFFLEFLLSGYEPHCFPPRKR